MILADKQLIQSQLKKSALKVREKELNYYAANFESIGMLSTLLAGFAFSALQTNIPADTSWGISLFFHLTFPASCMYSLFCVCNCTFISMFAPGLALRGADGSMQKAVEGMMIERNDLYTFYRLSILAIHLATAAIVWSYRAENVAGWLDGSVVSMMLAYSLYKLTGFTQRIQKRFSQKEIEGRKIAGILDRELYAQSSSRRRKKNFDPDQLRPSLLQGQHQDSNGQQERQRLTNQINALERRLREQEEIIKQKGLQT